MRGERLKSDVEPGLRRISSEPSTRSAFFKCLAAYPNRPIPLPDHPQLMHDCISRLADPVEGAAGSDAAWVQGFTMAMGMSALFGLTHAYSALTEALDRKAAYTMACLSLYIAVISLVLGVLSISG